MKESLNSFSTNTDPETKETEPTDNYGLAVAEILADYERRTPFEQRVMRDVVIGERITRDYIARREEDYRRFNDTMSVDNIKEEFERDFNMGINCGGFALEIVGCLFSNTENIDEAKNNILDTFPFVRVLGETELGPDEYRVFYRHKEGGFSHHFVKERNGVLIEKNEAGPVRLFTEWTDDLRDAPEIVFAVNENHDIHPVDKNGHRQWSFVI